MVLAKYHCDSSSPFHLARHKTDERICTSIRPHRSAIQKVRQGDWFKEELYARFNITAVDGHWSAFAQSARKKTQMNSAFPFSAIVGQDDMKLALTLTAIDPKIGGVLAFGDRGTGKSTAIRALADLLPKVDVVKAVP